MKKAAIAIIALSCLSIYGCGSTDKNKEDAENISKSTKENGPMEAESPLERKYSSKIDGHTYEITINRYPNHNLPTVKDQLDQVFYDNSVKLVVKKDGVSFLIKDFSKEAFIDYLNDNDKKSTILLGMAFDEDKSNASKICIAAQLGQPGSSEGPAYTIEISTTDGSCSIIKDLQQDTNAEKYNEGD